MDVIVVPGPAAGGGIYADDRDWARQWRTADPSTRRIVEISGQQGAADAIAALRVAASLAGPGGRVYALVGHGASGGHHGADIIVDLAPHWKLRITHNNIFYDPAQDRATVQHFRLRHPHQRLTGTALAAQHRIEIRQRYNEVGAILRTNQVASVTLMTCHVGNSDQALHQIADDWGVAVTAYRPRLASVRRAGHVMMYIEGFRPRTGFQRNYSLNQLPRPFGDDSGRAIFTALPGHTSAAPVIREVRHPSSAHKQSAGGKRADSVFPSELTGFPAGFELSAESGKVPVSPNPVSGPPPAVPAFDPGGHAAPDGFGPPPGVVSLSGMSEPDGGATDVRDDSDSGWAWLYDSTAPAPAEWLPPTDLAPIGTHDGLQDHASGQGEGTTPEPPTLDGYISPFEPYPFSDSAGTDQHTQLPGVTGGMHDPPSTESSGPSAQLPEDGLQSALLNLVDSLIATAPAPADGTLSPAAADVGVSSELDPSAPDGQISETADNPYDNIADNFDSTGADLVLDPSVSSADVDIAAMGDAAADSGYGSGDSPGIGDRDIGGYAGEDSPGFVGNEDGAFSGSDFDGGGF